jgi:hypothetical protein
MAGDGDLLRHILDDLRDLGQEFARVVVHIRAAAREHGYLVVIDDLDADAVWDPVDH